MDDDTQHFMTSSFCILLYLAIFLIVGSLVTPSPQLHMIFARSLFSLNLLCETMVPKIWCMGVFVHVSGLRD